MRVRSFLRHARWMRRLHRSALAGGVLLWVLGVGAVIAFASRNESALLLALVIASLAAPFVFAAVIEGAITPLIDRRFGLVRTRHGFVMRRLPHRRQSKTP